ncbi:methyltransferase domain-containing protein [Paenibacillus sp. Y412MC10]|uniref:methyltransferase domain-containing protein n=1 Tax=Geobacillus sp. (strain Y412MC10) TaxID=481743 RepID=UPI0011872103
MVRYQARISGKFILDAGCDEGYLSRLLSLQGAQKVVGVDYSKRWLRLLNVRHQKGQLLNKNKEVVKN